MRTLFLHIIFFLINTVIILICLEFSLGTSIFSIEQYNSPSNSISSDKAIQKTMIKSHEKKVGLYPSEEVIPGYYPKFEFEIFSALNFAPLRLKTGNYVDVEVGKAKNVKYGVPVLLESWTTIGDSRKKRSAPFALTRLDPYLHP